MDRDNFYYALKILVPNANFNFRPEGGMEIYQMAGWILEWNTQNGPCPNLQALEAVTPQQIADFIEGERKALRNAQKAQDLTMVALYEYYKIETPELTFSDFLDNLENNPPQI